MLGQGFGTHNPLEFDIYHFAYLSCWSLLATKEENRSGIPFRENASGFWQSRNLMGECFCQILALDPSLSPMQEVQEGWCTWNTVAYVLCHVHSHHRQMLLNIPHHSFIRQACCTSLRVFTYSNCCHGLGFKVLWTYSLMGSNKQGESLGQQFFA